MLLNAIRATTIERTIERRSDESNYKTNTNNEAKWLRSTTFAIAKMEKQERYGKQ